MRRARFRGALVIAVAVAAGAAVAAVVPAAAGASPRTAASAVHTGLAARRHTCAAGGVFCVPVAAPQPAVARNASAAFGASAPGGGDQPAVFYYSNRPGAGNQDSWMLTLPTDPPRAVVPGRSWTFELASAFWFGMALCDTQSYPQQVSTCRPDSNTNVTPLARHPGTALMQLQFYPPGWVAQPAGLSCDPTRWCAAMIIASLSEDPVNGTVLNPTCQAQVGAAETANFAFVTKSGRPIGSPNPVDITIASLTPANPGTFFMNPGDKIKVTMHDTPNGLTAIVSDQTTRQTGSMTASAANGFAQLNAAPTGTNCTVTPYDFHPMYSTSSPQTRVPWAAHSANIAFGEDIGNFDPCSTVDTGNSTCAGREGTSGDQEAADADDTGCLPTAPSPLVQVGGCTGTNLGFDGASYRRDWPDGNASLHPAPALFSSPLTGARYNVNYTRVALETTLPGIEGSCNRSTGTGCTLLPATDDSMSADFYPFFSVTQRNLAGGCRWFLGDTMPRLTASDFGGIFQYGTLLGQQYLSFGGHGATITQFSDYRQVLSGSPCPAP